MKSIQKPASPQHNNIEESGKSVSDNSKLVELTLKSDVVDWGGIVILNWKHKGIPTTSDWIGIFKRGEATNTQYVDYKYIGLADNSEKRSSFFSLLIFSFILFLLFIYL